MLTPTYLEHVADDIVELYAELDRTIVRDIIRRIAKTGNITETAEWQAEMAQHSGLLFDELVEEVAKADSTADKHLTKAFREAGIEAVEADRTIYKAAGKDLPSISLSPSAQQILAAGYRKTNGYLKNLTLTTAVQSQQLYIQAATLAEMQIESGAFDYNTAIRNAIKAAAKGGAWVQYSTGVRNRLETAVRRAVLTGVGQTTAEISLQNANDMGCDLMELTAHVGARPSHMTWQGKIVSLSGREGYLSLADIGYGTGDGFKGWNCRHDWFPFFEGLSGEAYPREKLLEYENKTVSFDGKDMSYYDATQRQRILERRIRDTKRDLAAYDEATKNGVDMSNEFTAASVKLKRQEAELNDFLNQTGIGRQREREQVAGFGRSQASKAVWANKKAVLPNYENAVITNGKIRGYALNKEHPKGKDKAIAFEKALGYNITNADDLIANVRNNLSKYRAKKREKTQYGQPYEVKMRLNGPNGKTAIVKTGWIIEFDSDKPRLTTIYVSED